MAGIDYLRAMVDGDLPQAPIGGLLQFGITAVEPGRVEFTCVPDESAYNPIGAIHGGLICTLLDSVTACAIHSTLPQGKGYTSVEIKVNYLKAVRLTSGVLTATGTVVQVGLARRFRRGRRHRRVRRGRRHRQQHAAGLRSVTRRKRRATFDGCRSGSW